MGKTAAEITTEVMEEFDEWARPAGMSDETWYPCSDADFEWCARKRKDALVRAAALRKLGDEQVRELERLFEVRIEQAVSTAERMGALIEDGVRRTTPDAKGHRRVTAPGVSAFTKRQEVWTWPSEGSLLAWAKMDETRASLLRVTETPDRAAIKAYVKRTGDAPEGLGIEFVERVEIRHA